MRESKAVIAIVDDDPSVREGLESLSRPAGLHLTLSIGSGELPTKPGLLERDCSEIHP